MAGVVAAFFCSASCRCMPPCVNGSLLQKNLDSTPALWKLQRVLRGPDGGAAPASASTCGHPCSPRRLLGCRPARCMALRPPQPNSSDDDKPDCPRKLDAAASPPSMRRPNPHSYTLLVTNLETEPQWSGNECATAMSAATSTKCASRWVTRIIPIIITSTSGYATYVIIAYLGGWSSSPLLHFPVINHSAPQSTTCTGLDTNTVPPSRQSRYTSSSTS